MSYNFQPEILMYFTRVYVFHLSMDSLSLCGKKKGEDWTHWVTAENLFRAFRQSGSHGPSPFLLKVAFKMPFLFIFQRCMKWTILFHATWIKLLAFSLFAKVAFFSHLSCPRKISSIGHIKKVENYRNESRSGVFGARPLFYRLTIV